MAVTGSVAWRRPRWVLAPRRCFSPVVREARQPYGQGPRLLDRVRERIRTRHYSRRTEKAYVGWIRRYILLHGRRHPREMGAEELSRYLSSLAVDAKVSASTQNQALAALLFLYREVLARTFPGSRGSCGRSSRDGFPWSSRATR